ncbi:prenyltransferase/squalene oxidase repeat-containing protein [Teredinibacter purpureus]|uniref:terpene cyclase/mutase family protein n=1 Tax=Teredinibacter purpureus TaxID=2731756 RepID=UPI0005F7D3BB|nr:terpene cyclase/mutase family protein [Teredinibacter purpureus]
MISLNTQHTGLNLPLIHRFIKSCQQDDGAIRWHGADKLDPWDHTEAAMALTILGDYSNARRAFNWLRHHQRANGSWQAAYFKQGDNTKIETNFVAYPATGIWHYFLVTQDHAFLTDYFDMVEQSIEYVLRHQSHEGDIQWAVSAQEELPKDALITACASVLRSLECAIQIAGTLSIEKPQWRTSYHALANALLHKPWRFDRTWESKARYSMDWFYPVLAGIYTQEESKLRLEKRWYEFVEESLGCRCVSDEPWVTIAESCELVMATVYAGERTKALTLFNWLSQWQDTDGGYWTGYSFRDKVIWPQEKTSWTAAAILLAADALYTLTPASALFTTRSSLIHD